jgi:hypothetical protein
MEGKGKSLAVQANFDRAPGAYAMHFGFSAPTDGDPFRLLILNAKNPPAPLRLAGKFLPNFRRDLAAPQPAALRLIPDFYLLAGQQWQLQPLLRTESHPAESQYLYKNWPSNDMPAAGHELDFADARRQLRAHREQLEAKRHSLSEHLGLPLGKHFGFDDTNLASFLSFSRRNLTRSRFLEYLDNLKDNAPEKSWIKKWRNQANPDHPGDVAGKFQKLYDLWCDKGQFVADRHQCGGTDELLYCRLAGFGRNGIGAGPVGPVKDEIRRAGSRLYRAVHRGCKAARAGAGNDSF